MNYIIDNNLKMPIDIFKNILQAKNKYNNEFTNYFYVMFDDASYSGRQMNEDITTQLHSVDYSIIENSISFNVEICNLGMIKA